MPFSREHPHTQVCTTLSLSGLFFNGFYTFLLLHFSFHSPRLVQLQFLLSGNTMDNPILVCPSSHNNIWADELALNGRNFTCTWVFPYFCTRCDLVNSTNSGGVNKQKHSTFYAFLICSGTTSNFRGSCLLLLLAGLWMRMWRRGELSTHLVRVEWRPLDPNLNTRFITLWE